MIYFAITVLIALIVGSAVGYGFGFWIGAAWQIALAEMYDDPRYQ